MRGGAVAVALFGLLLAVPAGAQTGDSPPPDEHDAVTILPPGQSGFVSVEGQARGVASGGEPSAYGDHLDDQREPYWNFQYKDGSFQANGTPEEPKEGVRIYRDDFGVPAIYADNGRDVWFGAGYAVARDRLFLMDAVRRMGRGTFAELTGPSGVPGDIQQRTLTYSDDEYMAFFEALSQEAKDSVLGYVDGANAWREKAISDPRLLPAEYVLLSTLPEEFTVLDVLAGGVLITRTVAADGGNEFSNVRALRELEDQYGTDEGRDVFRDFVWQEDPAAAVTVPDRSFVNQPGTPTERDAAFESSRAARAPATPRSRRSPTRPTTSTARRCRTRSRRPSTRSMSCAPACTAGPTPSRSGRSAPPPATRCSSAVRSWATATPRCSSSWRSTGAATTRGGCPCRACRPSASATASASRGR
jgi:hypothetical protein